MKTMPAGEFKARCLAVMEDVSKTREPVVITKRGKPVAKLVPAEKSERPFIGRLEGIVASRSLRDSEGTARRWPGDFRDHTMGARVPDCQGQDPSLRYGGCILTAADRGSGH